MQQTAGGSGVLSVIANVPMPASSDLLRLRLRDVMRFRLRDMVTASPALRELSPELVRAIGASKRQFLKETQTQQNRFSLSAHMARGLVHYLTGEHQYLHLGNGRRSEIACLYSLFVDELRLTLMRDASDKAEGAKTAISRHHDRLSFLVRGALEEAGALARVLEEPHAPVCASYSPAFQFRVLGIDPDRLAGPILDLGCGADGKLVAHLRGRGRQDAFGIDQNAAEPDGVFRGSWFEAPLGPCTWGTVIAHQSFSLHFAHAHLRSDKQAKAYAQTYMRILESLKPGGCFAYAPGVPFIERLLPAEWHVRAQPLSRMGHLPAVGEATSLSFAEEADTRSIGFAHPRPARPMILLRQPAVSLERMAHRYRPERLPEFGEFGSRPAPTFKPAAAAAVKSGSIANGVSHVHNPHHRQLRLASPPPSNHS